MAGRGHAIILTASRVRVSGRRLFFFGQVVGHSRSRVWARDGAIARPCYETLV